ncbi:MAG: bifunctional riboflavin kinase/FAD synthetase [Solitalea-like symbiont of Tyrophagus putrescentiae]
MKILNNINEFRDKPPVVLTIGSFDGVHLAHVPIIEEVVRQGVESDSNSLVITFEPHPQLVLKKDDDFKILTTLSEKINKLSKLNIDYLLVPEFNKELYSLSPVDFIELLLKYLDIKGVVIGYNHTFGKGKVGNFNLLKDLSSKYGFKVTQIPRINLDADKVSSSQIREKLFNCDIKGANKLLGYNYNFVGTVIYGDQLGRKIGFPTANLVIQDKAKLILPDSCYVVKVKVNNQIFNGMMYIGNRPTVNGLTHNIEVNIFDFDDYIYGMEITVYVLDYLRGDIKFDGLDALIRQLKLDRLKSIEMLDSY